MKMMTVMSLATDADSIHHVFDQSDVQVYTEMAVAGHTKSTLEEFGWFVSKPADSQYSTLCFAVVPDEQADDIMDAIRKLRDERPSDHPIRAFQVHVEKMI